MTLQDNIVTSPCGNEPECRVMSLTVTRNLGNSFGFSIEQLCFYYWEMNDCDEKDNQRGKTRKAGL